MPAPGQIVTRFAPSPTGFLHIGGARTALFNWLYAKRMGGIFRLRIEDTDRARSTPEAIEAILEGLDWLGLQHDDEVVYQFARAARHREVVDELLAKGAAYKCYASQEELEAMRAEQKAAGKPMRYDGRWRDRVPDGPLPNVPPVIRLKAPQTGETIIDDQVQGEVKFRNDVLDDFILLRSDGNPTYMLSVVVDDYDMGVTHIIRGDDHLTNAARQRQIIDAMGWPKPVYAHLPLMHGEDGAKLSKRHGALGIHEYQNLGYLPEAMRNYLLRLGWSHGDDETISTAQAIDWFNLESIGRSPARVDFKKLNNLNGHYMRAADDGELAVAAQQLIGRMGRPPLTATQEAQLLKAMPSLKDRAKTLVELIDNMSFIFVERPLTPDEKALKALSEDARARLKRLGAALADVPWTAPEIEAAVRTFAEAEQAKLGDVAQPLRAALTGRTVSPPVFDVMATLGREEALARIADQAAA
ncbi:Glutamate--tRNA ligase [Alphaproteobacteria bacterium SO-S41]|nr:Glutamate--tRNA ligase [Alphaproteobacteria bacterium SO-S41]